MGIAFIFFVFAFDFIFRHAHLFHELAFLNHEVSPGDGEGKQYIYSASDYEAAEKNYRDALITYPDYYRALAGLGKTLAARGDLAGGIVQYERVVNILPEPAFVAALGDLYKLTGREKEANTQYALIEQSGKLSQAKGNLYNRQLALFYADHEVKAQDAYALAKKE